MTLPLAAALLVAAAADRPNVLLIVADDLGYADVGFTGCKDIPTPHLDALAAAGTVCRAGYVTCPYCAPSRAGLLTGRYPTRFGFEFNPTPGLPGAGLPADRPTLAERLRAAGYATGAVGKWHLGSPPGRRPTDRGFGEFFGFLGGAHSYFPDEGKGQLVRGGDRVGEPDYLTAAFGREAAAFVDRHRRGPWFLYLAFNAVHAPMHARAADLGRVPHAAGKLRKAYAGMLVAMDDAVGRVLAAVKAAGADDRTLVVFLSDNGGPTAPLNSNVNGSVNAPYRGGKRQLTEGGVRVPFVVRWTGTVPAGRALDAPVSALDVVPTCLAAAGAATPDPLDGTDVLPLLKGGPAAERALFWRFGRQSAVRLGDWKLVTWKTDDGGAFPSGLFDLRADPGEANDRSAARPDKVRELRALWEAWDGGNAAPAWGTPGELEEHRASRGDG